jgi:DNA-directed RNA polymerase subunit RPC12/RpoP
MARKIKCGYCNKDFKYRADEVKQHSSIDYNKYVICPRCKKEVIVERISKVIG